MKSWKVFNLIAKDTVSHLYFCLETPAGRVVVDHEYFAYMWASNNNFIIQFQCDLSFFSTEIVNCRSCCWIPLINFAMI